MKTPPIAMPATVPAVTSIALLNLRRVFTDRTNIFFVIVAPFLLILVIGQLSGGGQQLRLGVAADGAGPLAGRLVAALGSGPRITVERVGGEEDLRLAVERGRVNAGLVVPGGYDADLAAGRPVELRSLVRPDDLNAQDVAMWTRSVVAEEAALVRAAQFGAARGAGSFGEVLRAAETSSVPGIEVRTTTTGDAVFPEGLGAFAISAPPLLLMFVFLTSLTAAVGLVETRMLGVSRRMYASPTPVRTIVLGEALGRIVIALAQGLLIMLGSALLFGVEWGDPLGAAALLVVFSLVGGGAAMLLGSLFRTPGPPAAIALILGLGLAALGGSMMPLESFGPTMRTLAHLTPHAWGYEGFAELVRHGATVTAILPQLGALTVYAAVLLASGGLRLRRALTS
ncbi:ABC transporter permease [Planobispora longispora]|uniref:Putative transport permease YfiM n=1 Tax=Planobispora longispora TaxID=28887 RepID=A0A8J3RP48_9ACTN|nr:ABC transporter permease [Planobispora longispora]GIH78554.1 putative transport permease YfiM [Planobispora longispora]